MVTEQVNLKTLTDEQCQAIFNEAYQAGLAAGNDAQCPTMVVQQHQHPLNDNSPVVKQYIVPDGPCGFANVNVTPTVSRFAKWLRKTEKGRYSNYDRCVYYFVHEHRQSLTRKEQHARAFAKVLQSYGITAYPQSRID